MSCQNCQDETRDCYACSLRERISVELARALTAEAEVERLRAALESIAAVARNHDERWVADLADSALRPTTTRKDDTDGG